MNSWKFPSEDFPLFIYRSHRPYYVNADVNNKKTNTHTHTCLTALCPGLPRWAGTRKVTPIWILLKQETVSGSGISWAICKPAPGSRQITTSAPHYSVFYRPDALPATQPTASKHWRQKQKNKEDNYFFSLSMHVVYSGTLVSLFLTTVIQLLLFAKHRVVW